METKHTPGPWWIDDDSFIASGNGETYKTIADPHCSDMDIDERMENARLIAAAPKLLETLNKVIEQLSPIIYKMSVKKAFSELLTIEEAKKLIRSLT